MNKLDAVGYNTAEALRRMIAREICDKIGDSAPTGFHGFVYTELDFGVFVSCVEWLNALVDAYDEQTYIP